MFSVHVTFPLRYIFKYRLRKRSILCKELKTFFCYHESSPFKLQSKNHIIIPPVDIEEANISFFRKGKHEIDDDFELKKEIRLEARLSRNIAFFPLYLFTNGSKRIIYVLMNENLTVGKIIDALQKHFQIGPIGLSYLAHDNKMKKMKIDDLFNSYKDWKKIYIIFPDSKSFSFVLHPNTEPLFDMVISFKSPIKILLAQVADQINKRYSLKKSLTQSNIDLFIMGKNTNIQSPDQLKGIRGKEYILIKVKDAEIPKNPTYFFLFPENSNPQPFELDSDWTVGTFIEKKLDGKKDIYLLCDGKKMKKKAKFSEQRLTMGNLIIVMKKHCKIHLKISLPKQSFNIVFKNCYQIKELYEKVKEYVGSSPFELYYKKQLLDDNKTCGDYGIGDNSEIKLEFQNSFSPCSSALNLLRSENIHNESGDIVVQEGATIFMMRDMNPITHVFDKQATILKAKNFIINTLNSCSECILPSLLSESAEFITPNLQDSCKRVTNVNIAFFGRILSDDVKLSSLPISIENPLNVILKYDNEEIKIRDTSNVMRKISTFDFIFFNEDNGTSVTVTLPKVSTVGDAIQSLSESETIDNTDIIEITFDNSICSDLNSLLMDIQKLKPDEHFYYRVKTKIGSTQQQILKAYSRYTGRALRKLSFSKDPNLDDLFFIENQRRLSLNSSDVFNLD